VDTIEKVCFTIVFLIVGYASGKLIYEIGELNITTAILVGAILCIALTIKVIWTKDSPCSEEL
jgi:hypothetical protein